MDNAIFAVVKTKEGIKIDTHGFNKFEIFGILFHEIINISSAVNEHYVKRVPVKKKAAVKKTTTGKKRGPKPKGKKRGPKPKEK